MEKLCVFLYYIYKTSKYTYFTEKIIIILKTHYFIAVIVRWMQRFIAYFNILGGKTVPYYSP